MADKICDRCGANLTKKERHKSGCPKFRDDATTNTTDGGLVINPAHVNNDTVTNVKSGDGDFSGDTGSGGSYSDSSSDGGSSGGDGGGGGGD